MQSIELPLRGKFNQRQISVVDEWPMIDEWIMIAARRSGDGLYLFHDKWLR
jgi:hypothetical protein